MAQVPRGDAGLAGTLMPEAKEPVAPDTAVNPGPGVDPSLSNVGSTPKSPVERRLPLSVLLRALADDQARERIAIGDLLAALGDRALGALLFVFALPNIFPTPPGASTLLGLPLLFLAAQLTFGRRPWLPAFIARRSLSRDDIRGLVHRLSPWVERAERLLRPRWSIFALPPMEYLVGLVCLLLATILVLPIPLGNIPPALAIALMGLGIVERDGIWVVVGLVVAVASTIVVSGVVLAMSKTAVYLFSQVFQ